MKKICIMAIIMAMLLSVSAVAAAEEDPLSLSDANVRAGQTIYLTLKLNTAVTGDTMGVSYTYDRNILEAVVSSCTWSKKGSLSNFNREDDGVWATNTPVDLTGDICVLAFRVKSGAEFADTSVSCTLVIKNGSQEQGTYTAQAQVSYSCEHSFGNWENGGEIGHMKTCAYCGETRTAAHTLGTGVTTEKPNDPDNDLLIYKCEICDYVRQVEIPKQQEEMSAAPTHWTQEATEPPRSEDNSGQQSAMPTEIPTMTVPTAPPNHTDKETDISAEPTQPYRSDTSKPPQSDNKDTHEDSTDKNASQTTTSPGTSQPSEGRLDSNHGDSVPGKDDASSVKPEGNRDDSSSGNKNEGSGLSQNGQGTGANNSETGNDSSLNRHEGSEQHQSGQSSTATNPAPGVSYPDDSSNVITQSEREHEEINPAPTFSVTESTTPYKDYNAQPEDKMDSNVPPVNIEDALVCTDPAHDHDHVHTYDESDTNKGNPALNAVILVAFLTVTIGGAVLYLKKKRK